MSHIDTSVLERQRRDAKTGLRKLPYRRGISQAAMRKSKAAYNRVIDRTDKLLGEVKVPKQKRSITQDLLENAKHFARTLSPERTVEKLREIGKD